MCYLPSSRRPCNSYSQVWLRLRDGLPSLMRPSNWASIGNMCRKGYWLDVSVRWLCLSKNSARLCNSMEKSYRNIGSASWNSGFCKESPIYPLLLFSHGFEALLCLDRKTEAMIAKEISTWCGAVDQGNHWLHFLSFLYLRTIFTLSYWCLSTFVQ